MAAPPDHRDAGAPREAALHDIVGDALSAFADATAFEERVTTGLLASALRAAAVELEKGRLAVPDGGARGHLVAQLYVACAHLGAEDFVEARLVLAALHDSLARHQDRGVNEADPANTHTRTPSTTRKRALRRRATVEQAVGVVAVHGGTSPRAALTVLRAHAARRGLALLELADDVVDGRVDASTILPAPPAGRRS